MPAPQVIFDTLIAPAPNVNSTGTNATNIPSASGTSTAGVAIGVPPAGHLTVDNVSGTIYVNAATAGNAFLPRAPLVNCVDLWEFFKQRPALNAVLALADASGGAGPTAAAFAAYTIANKDFEVLGTNMTTALATFADGGGVTLTTAGANNDQAIVTPHLDSTQTGWASTKWNTNDEVLFETTIKTGASVASLKIFAGLKLTNTPLTATDNDQAYFLFDTGNTNSVSATNFQICTSRSGTDTFVDSGITVQASTTYHLKIQIDQNNIPCFYINGVLVGVGNGTDTSGVTTSTGALTSDIDLIPYVGVQALTGAAKAVTVRAIHMQKTFND